MLIDATDASAALAWGDRIAQKYIAQLHSAPEVDWAIQGYASFIEQDRSQLAAADWPRVTVGDYPDFDPWLCQDLA